MNLANLAGLALIAAFCALAVLELLCGRQQVRNGPETGGRALTNFGLGMLVLLAGSLPLVARLGASAADASWGLGLAHAIAIAWPLVFLATLLASSLTAYWVHRAFHAVPLLWRVHRIHHTDEHLDLSTGLRNHPLELAVTIPVGAATVFLLGAPASAVIASDALLFAVGLWQHAEITLPPWLERRLGLVIVTPALHRTHHASERRLHDHNYGDITPVWDRLFGTLTPGIGPDERIGLHGQRARADSLLAQLRSPLYPLQEATSPRSAHRPPATTGRTMREARSGDA